MFLEFCLNFSGNNVKIKESGLCSQQLSMNWSNLVRMWIMIRIYILSPYMYYIRGQICALPSSFIRLPFLFIIKCSSVNRIIFQLRFEKYGSYKWHQIKNLN